LTAVVVLIAGVQQLPAAEFRKSSLEVGKPDLLVVTGDLAIGDEKKFIQLALGTDDAVVVFHSPGGNLFAGIEIGKAIHLKGFSTYVPDGSLCASACSLAWLGGRSRLMSDTAKVGFHAAYTDQRGQNNVSAPGNAVVGAYLNQLNLPISAIIYITQAAPDGMQWLNFSDAQRFGIEVKKFNLASRTPVEAPRQRESAVNEEIERETRALINAGNLADAAAALNYISGKYSNQVQYYGKSLTKAEVLADKRTFLRRWTERRYAVVANSVEVTCSEVSTCKVEGRLDWEATNSQARSAGSASFSYTWTMDAGAWKVNGESSKVLGRTVSSLITSPTAAAPSTPSRSLWQHNGSVMYLAADGASRRFYYDTPREGLDSVGVKRGTLLFEGQKNGDQYSGTAYFFSKICGPGTYAVSGPVASNESQITITLSGKAPRLDANCKQIGARDDVLIFTYMASAPN
jgi:hypothetical protein